MSKSASDEDRTMKAPLALALFGFTPFAVLTGALFLPGEPWLQSIVPVALTTYAAIILSFLGGIRWGIAVAAPESADVMPVFALSVVPSLWGWAAFLAPDAIGFVMFAVGFGAMGMWDRMLVARGGAPRWFGLLRTVLTWLVTPTMLLAAIAVLI